MNNPNIWAIVPAHNEGSIIAGTIRDLVSQTLTVTILVVLDNCTDNTLDVVKNLIPYYPNLYFFVTKENRKKKAGAINQALKNLSNNGGIDALLIMDADTRIDKHAVEFGWNKLNSNSKLAAVCSKAGVLPFPCQEKNLFRHFLYELQRLEYSEFDAQRVETFGNIKVVHGMAALHRWTALKKVGGFDEDNLVEDYELTIKYKEAGYNVTAELSMKAWTELPLSLKEWWKQRLRWNRGGLDTLKDHGWNNITRRYILQHYWMNIFMAFQWVFFAAFVTMLIQREFSMHGLVLILTAVSILASLYRLKYLERISFIDILFRVSLIPEVFYEFMISINLYHSYFLFFSKKEQSW
jgi:cellulose synthase/poly-beta-1,6-N-acetylglucosamine synthase-like glycosyltransferase